MRSLLGAVFVLILMSFHGGHATRYLPSIVWDHLNPMLLCKCNWFHPMTTMEIYDRFEFVCPTPKITVLLLDSYSRPDDQMNVNLFQRKWTGGHHEAGINELKRQMMDGSFCDPNSNETKRLYTCKNGQDGKGKTMRFARDTDFYKFDIVVFFNNGDDGRESTLPSKEKRCAMALVVKLTWGVAMKYDFTYGKNLTADPTQCDEETVCEREKKTSSDQLELRVKEDPDLKDGMLTLSNINITISQNTNSTISPNTSTTISQNTSARTPQRTNSTICLPSNAPDKKASVGERSSVESWDRFKYGVLVGFAVALLLNCFIGVIYFFISSNSKRGKKSDHGVNNVAYQPQTLKRGGGRSYFI